MHWKQLQHQQSNLPLSSVRSPMSFKPLESVTICWEEKVEYQKHDHQNSQKRKKNAPEI